MENEEKYLREQLETPFMDLEVYSKIKEKLNLLENSNVTRSEQNSSEISFIESIINRFEELLINHNSKSRSYKLAIFGEYSRNTCDLIETMYRNKGWNNVKCITSSEKGERGGLTMLSISKPNNVQ